jgi:hypothetical protein
MLARKLLEMGEWHGLFQINITPKPAFVERMLSLAPTRMSLKTDIKPPQLNSSMLSIS